MGIELGILAAMQADQQNKRAEADAKAAEIQENYNRKIEEQEAKAVEAETMENARRGREESRSLMASQRAALGASGAALAGGSPLALLAETAADEERKIQDLHYSGARDAAAHRTQAALHRYRASVARASRPTSWEKTLNITAGAANGFMQGVNLAVSLAGTAAK